MAGLENIQTALLFDEILRRCEGDADDELREEVELAFRIYKERQRDRQIFSVGGGKEYKALFENHWFDDMYWTIDSCQQARVDKYFPRAIAKGYMTVTDKGECVWVNKEYGAKTELALFMYYLFDKGVGVAIPYKSFGRLFGVKYMYNIMIGALDRIKKPKRFHSTKAVAHKLERELFYD